MAWHHDDFLREKAYGERAEDILADAKAWVDRQKEPVGPRKVPCKDQYFIDMLPAIAARSKDPKNQVGCVIVGNDGEHRASGHNGFPAGVDETPARWASPAKYNYVTHAEANAIAAAAKVGTPLAACIAYVSFAPCTACAKLMLAAGIWEVVVDKVNHDRVISDRWAKDQEIVEEMFDEAGVILRWWTGEGK